MKTIKLKEGQRVFDINGNEYLIEKGDVLQESVNPDSLVSEYGIDLNNIVNSYTDKHGITTTIYNSTKGKYQLSISEAHGKILYVEVLYRAIGGWMETKTSIGEYPIKTKFSVGDTFKMKWPNWDDEVVFAKVSKIEYDGLGFDEVEYRYNIYIRSLETADKKGWGVEDDMDTFDEKDLLKLVV